MSLRVKGYYFTNPQVLITVDKIALLSLCETSIALVFRWLAHLGGNEEKESMASIGSLLLPGSTIARLKVWPK